MPGERHTSRRIAKGKKNLSARFEELERPKTWQFAFYSGPEAVRQAPYEARGTIGGEKLDRLLRRRLHEYQLPARRLSGFGNGQGKLPFSDSMAQQLYRDNR